MNNDIKIKIFLVDDDAVFVKSLKTEFLEHADFNISTFATGELCLDRLSDEPDVIVLDYKLNSIVEDAMNGIETLDKIKKYNPAIPVVMLSSQYRIDVAVDCLQHDAFDYAVKSETGFFRLQKIITSIFLSKKYKKEIETVYSSGQNPFHLSVSSC